MNIAEEVVLLKKELQELKNSFLQREKILQSQTSIESIEGKAQRIIINGNTYYITADGKAILKQIGIGTDYPLSELQIESNGPRFTWRESDGAVNNKIWDFAAAGEQFRGRIINDAYSVFVNWITVDRTGTVVNKVVFPAGQVGINTEIFLGSEKLRVVGGAKFGNATNRVDIDAFGDMTFIGGGGLAFGSFKGNEIVWTQVAADGVWYTITDEDISAGQIHNTIFQNNGEIKVSKAGRYLVHYYISVESSIAGKHVITAPEINGTEQADGQTHHEFGRAIEEESWGGSAILDLAVDNVISVGIVCSDAGNPTLTVNHVGLTLVQIGGT